MIPHAVELDPLIVINVEILALCCGKHCLVLQEADIPDLVLGLELTQQVFLFPIEQGKMAFAPSKNQMLTIFSGIDAVGSKVLQLQIEDVICILNG